MRRSSLRSVMLAAITTGSLLHALLAAPVAQAAPSSHLSVRRFGAHEVLPTFTVYPSSGTKFDPTATVGAGFEAYSEPNGEVFRWDGFAQHEVEGAKAGPAFEHHPKESSGGVLVAQLTPDFVTIWGQGLLGESVAGRLTVHIGAIVFEFENVTPASGGSSPIPIENCYKIDPEFSDEPRQVNCDPTAPCLIQGWINVTDFAIKSVDDSIVVSANLASLDERNPADFFFGRVPHSQAWLFNGFLVIADGTDEADYDFDVSYDTIRIGRYDNGNLTTLGYFPLTLTPTHFEFRFPSSILAGHRFGYYCTFDEVSANGCYIKFNGTLDLPNLTPTRRISLGALKVRWAR